MSQPVLSIAVAAHREFTLPTDLTAAVAHFRDFRGTLQDLPELRLTELYSNDRYRVLYSAAVAGVYQVELYSDIQARFNEVDHVLLVTPWRGLAPAASRASWSSLTGQGEYSSRLALRSAGAQTQASYDVAITASIPKPLALRLLPDAIARSAVERVVQRRVQEITDRFIERSRLRLRR
ncbi:MAG: hypothetical protein Q7T10_08455 [Rhodoferax sp.]|uniref:hypothetical protein n=1 Tax=Rhodoferax sp. TaxID=50421 RepID=UPI002723AC27|nr:hypothetical protein [Rhodoferax sp.]MDO8448826.1 hypothetical protein [Rhodoferax sp.]